MSGIDTISTTPDPEHLMGKENFTYSSKRLEVSSDSGPSQCISKWSDGGNHRVPKARKGGEHEWVIIQPYRKGFSIDIFF